MAHGRFVWCDLSAHDAQTSRRFYSDTLGWVMHDDQGYATATIARQPVAGHFQMPQAFIDMKMPAFWMSYISVDDIQATVTQAKALGGKVELGPKPFDAGGQYALIRDPLGAGFTVYQGDALQGATAGHTMRAGHGLFVSDADAIIPFYAALFGWQFEAAGQNIHAATLQGEHLFYCHSIPDPAVRGKEQFWAVYFAASDLDAMAKKIGSAGGTVISKTDLPEGPALWAHDPDGAVFALLQTKRKAIAPKPPFLAWIGIALILISSFTPQLWPWVIFLGLWAYTGLRDRATYLFQQIERAKHPLTYWAIIGTYALLFALTLWLALTGDAYAVSG
jgi:hypothetical protein